MRRLGPSLRFPKSIACGSRTLHTTTPKLEDVGPMASVLRSRSVVRFRGADTLKFLQGLLTNDVRRFAAPAGEKGSDSAPVTPNLAALAAPPMYAVPLTPQGSFLYDMFFVQAGWGQRGARPDWVWTQVRPGRVGRAVDGCEYF